ncbi:hypothetical protein GCM10023231_18120 [Olivibacter ginsenosidimutans]|uniref:Uncharacterized protein n=2 Tax=Olivibacter ginsenosidimutans TaxID=1176537 RepID=A0ABP9B747_9SPHI
MGDRFSPTDNVDIYYSSKDVKHEYKVIGHITADVIANEESSKRSIIQKAKAVGADAVIIHGIEYKGDKDSSGYSKAETIKYVQE